MSDTLRVTVAPGAVFYLSPHPSGLAGLPPLELHGGHSFDATPAEAMRLYDERRIVHPVTGELKPHPPRPAGPSGVTISYGGGPMRRADSQDWVMDAAQAERVALDELAVRNNAAIDARNVGIRPHNAVGPVRPVGPLPSVSDLDQPVDPFGPEHTSSSQEKPR